MSLAGGGGGAAALSKFQPCWKAPGPYSERGGGLQSKPRSKLQAHLSQAERQSSLAAPFRLDGITPSLQTAAQVAGPADALLPSLAPMVWLVKDRRVVTIQPGSLAALRAHVGPKAGDGWSHGA